MIETKVAAGSFTGILTGLLTWALVAYVPAFRAGLPAPVAALIPVAAAWLAHSIAAYLAPHTPRTALPIPGITPPGNVRLTRGGYAAGDTGAEDLPPPPPGVTVTPPPPARLMP